MSHRDLLAEIELTMVPSLQKRSDLDLYVPASEASDDSQSRVRRRSFWCALKEQVVEVEFETRACFGFRRPVGVNRCSAFEEPDKVACGRRCLESRFRRQWPYAVPVADNRRAPAG